MFLIYNEIREQLKGLRNMKSYRLLAIILIFVLCLTILSSCGGTPEVTEGTIESKVELSETVSEGNETEKSSETDVTDETGAKECSHEYVIVPEKPATEFETGHSEYKECSVCGNVEGYEVLEATHRHKLTEAAEGEKNPLFYSCKCGFSVISDLRSRPLIDQLSEEQYGEFLKLYNMFKNRESSCELKISVEEYKLFYNLIQGQCPEIFLLEYQNAAPTFYYTDVNGVVGEGRVEWNPDCMSQEKYTSACDIMAETFIEWEKACRDLPDAEKIRYMVEWMVENTEFETIGTNVRSLYGGIIERKIACVGYAQILSWTMNNFGVPCISVAGLAGDEGHMWNLVKLDGEWYQVDAGWNYVNVNGTNYSHNGYVNVSDKELMIGTARTYYDFYENCGVRLPTCTATEQNIARLSGYFVEVSNGAGAAFDAAVAQACERGDDIFTLVCNSQNVQNAILSYAQGAEKVLKSNGIKRTWIVSGHDDRTNIYFVSVLMSRPNRDEFSVTSADKQESIGYKLAIEQNENGQTVFFSGKTTDKYLSTVADPDRATDVFYKEVDGGFRLWFMDGFLKKYVDIAISEDGKAYATASLTPTAIFRIDGATGAIVADIGGETYWLGTYNEHSTIGANKIGYISGGNEGKIGVSQFPARLVSIDGREPVLMNEPPIPKGEGSAYKLVMEQKKLGKTLYFQGWRTRNFPASTMDREASPNIYLEEVDGGYQLYYLWGENKMYINVQGFEGKGVSVQLRDEPGEAFTYNETLGLYTVNMYGTDYYLGCYGEYDNFSLNDIKYITGENAYQIGVTQFPAYLVKVDD